MEAAATLNTIACPADSLRIVRIPPGCIMQTRDTAEHIVGHCHPIPRMRRGLLGLLHLRIEVVAYKGRRVPHLREYHVVFTRPTRRATVRGRQICSQDYEASQCVWEMVAEGALSALPTGPWCSLCRLPIYSRDAPGDVRQGELPGGHDPPGRISLDMSASPPPFQSAWLPGAGGRCTRH